jgi:hypothetical protein
LAVTDQLLRGRGIAVEQHARTAVLAVFTLTRPSI